ncbi:DUF3168 domain-containing protein [Achromobacter marplatensis]
MALISVIVPQALNSLVADKVFPGVAPLGTEPAWIIYTAAGGVPIGDVDGPDRIRNCRLRVDIYAADLDEAEALVQAVGAAMYAQLKAMPLGEWSSSREEETNLTRITQDFSLYY